jgi:molecular chaperone DnaK (HSP70)
MRLGIDFGTTRTVVACADRGNYPVVGFTDERGDAVDWFPSVVAERDGELRFGFAAEACDSTWTVVRSFKRWLSDGAHDRRVRVGSLELPLVELIARFLGALREALLQQSNLPSPSSMERLEAAIAVPANAHSTQRFVTLDAFRRAGFEVRAMLNEPSAAGFEYTHRYADTLNSRRETIVVYDLGGGTFDASLVRMSGRHHDALVTAGVNRLGGDDFDAALAELALAAAGRAAVAGGRGCAESPAGGLEPSQGSNVSDNRALLDACRAAKEGLNPSSRKIAVEVGGETVTLAVADYYDRVAPMIARSLEVMQPLVAPDGVDRDDLAGVYIVGGASALPAVGRALRDRFGRRAHRSPYPFAAIAIGLAIAADGEAGYALTDRLSRNFGVFREADGGRDVAFDVILARDLELPSQGTFSLMREYRAAHNIGHFRFVECSGVDGTTPTGDVTPLGDVLFPFDVALRDRPLDGVPVERVGDGPAVREVYSIDPHGIVAVTITDLGSGFQREFRLG